mmetsp:Transcript_25/g.101  ORF Transcript_25/g.101 Transcript_25/m.101 type:complete len:259 (-) Transcript_25:332-1108(-)
MAALTALLLPSFLGWSPRTGLPPLGARSGRMAGPVARAAGAGGGMIDGVRIGPPPDMPSMLLNNRIVYLGSPINSQVSELIVGQLLFLQYDSTEQPITMYINSPGTTLEDGRPVGFETEAFAIADTMGYIKPQISTMLVGKAYGLAALLLASGSKGHRTTLPYCTVMLHQPRGQMARGQASDIAIKAREVLTNRNVAYEMMAKATGQPVEKLSADMNRCLYLNAQEAIDYGICDRVITKKQGGLDLRDDMSSLSRGIG